MKKDLILISILLLTTLGYGEVEYESIFPNIAISGKSAAMGSVNLIDSPDKYTNNQGINFEMGQKEQLGVIPYSYYKLGIKNFGIKIITSDEILKTTKVSLGTSYKFWKFSVGADLNIYNAEIQNQETGSYEIIEKANEMGIESEDLTGTTAKGVGTDISIAFDLSQNISLGYYLKNINTNLEWDIENGEKLEEEVGLKDGFGILYNKDNISICGEIENVERLNLGFERNYYEKLDLRMGLSRNLKTKSNRKSQKLYSIGIGFVPGKINLSNRELKIGVDVGYQMKYFGDNDIFNGNSEDDIAFSLNLKF